MKINNCDDGCIKDGRCENCLGLQVQRSAYNKTVLDDKDERNRSIWIDCSTNIDNCSIEYAAMRSDNGSYHYMILKNCDPTQEEQIAGAVNGMLRLNSYLFYHTNTKVCLSITFSRSLH